MCTCVDNSYDSLMIIISLTMIFLVAFYVICHHSLLVSCLPVVSMIVRHCTVDSLYFLLSSSGEPHVHWLTIVDVAERFEAFCIFF